MKKLYLPACICLAALLFSCAAFPGLRESPLEISPSEQVASERVSAEPGPIRTNFTRPPARPEKPPVPEFIMGTGRVSPRDKAAFLLSANPRLDRNYVENLAVFYFEEAAIEGVNHDIAFAQMCLETGFLSYGNLVTADQNNFAGLGAIGPGQPGLSFPNPRIGVRAHVQHLKAYASEAPLNQELVNPRYRFVRRGSAPTIKGLSGTWAADRSYDTKINNILERLYNFVY